MRLLIAALLAGWLAIGLAHAAPAPASASSSASYDSAVADARAVMFADPRQALAQAQAAERLVNRVSADRRPAARATTQWLQAEALVRLDRAAEAKPLIEAALRVASQMRPHTKLLGDVLTTSGAAQFGFTKVAQALSDYQAAFRAYREINDPRGQAIALISIAELYVQAKDYEAALKYFSQANDIYRGEPAFTMSVLNNQAVVLRDSGRCHAAEGRFEQALAVARSIGSPLPRAQILRNLARCELVLGDVGQAHASLAAAQRLMEQGGVDKDELLLAVQAQAALQSGDRASAERLIDDAFRDIDLGKTTLPFRPAHETAVAVYRAVGDNAAALAHLAALKRLDDQATKLATSTSTALMAARFDFANQELKIAKLRQDELARSIAYEQQRARTERLIFVGSISGTAVIIALLGFGLVTIRRSRNEVRAANADLAVTNTALGKALAAKTEFLATTSHEIRTPLNGILGMAQVMLADDALDDGTRDRLKVVHGAGLTMRALVDDILDVAKMETGNLTIEEAPFDLKATIADATRLWEVQAEAKGLRFDRDLDACPGMIEGDSARVRQVAFNLLSNALKFTAEGGVSLRLSVEPDGRHYRIAVTDTGVGIPEDKREEIFESFRQADTSVTRQFGGTGLGLSICRNLAQAMGGEITVESEVGRGSTFAVTLPLVAAAVPEPAIAHADGGGTRLVILDRNPIARSMLRTLFAAHVDTLSFADDIDQAVAEMKSGGVSYLLADAAAIRAAPDMRDAARRLTETAQGSATAAAVLWPGDDAEGRSMLSEVGISLVIAKPIAGGALVAALLGRTEGERQDQRLVREAA